jgi:hypothetical protein
MLYDQEAIKKCREYYIKYNADAKKIEQAMRQDWSSWSRYNLYDRGKGKELRMGWINKYGFERSMQEALNLRINRIQSDDHRRYEAVVTLADTYQKKALNGEESAVPIFLKLTDQQIALRTKLDLGTANFEAFVEAFESIIEWSKDINVKLAREFYRDREEFIRRAKLKYGAEEGKD